MEKIILCRTAWMKYYEGRANIDIPRSGAKYILKNKTGGEIYNFKNRDGKVFGNFPFISSLSLKNLDKTLNREYLENVTVVFCATHPTERIMRVVGWYRKSRLYETSQSNRYGSYYHAVTNFKNIHLIEEDDRIFKLPKTFGRSSLYYIALHPKKAKLLVALKNYIANNGKIEKVATKSKLIEGIAFQPDIEKRLLVEQTAVNFAKQFYAKRYGGMKNIKSVESEKKGWDLEVKTDTFKINIEVKGQSGAELNVELTPNEFKAFNKCSQNYHLFVANEVLSNNPIIRVFKYQKKGSIWVANDKSVLNPPIKRVSAALRLKKVI
ncbi:MAG: DUF3883 domain-containing protein [Bacteroidetes bacterium]|nr:DUF3883 domain-containing protein [Bacteroidota bacterium]